MDSLHRHALSKGRTPNSITRQAASRSRQWTIQPRAAEYIEIAWPLPSMLRFSQHREVPHFYPFCLHFDGEVSCQAVEVFQF